MIPKQWNEMIKVAELLAKDIPYVRVDIYVIDEKVLFGELTFYLGWVYALSASGMGSQAWQYINAT